MDPKANPIHEQGERNIFCPYYSNCLDYAVKRSWQSWNCSQCPNKLVQSIPECEYGVDDTDLYYDLPPNVERGIGKGLFD